MLEYGSLENALKARQKIEEGKAKVEKRVEDLKKINKSDRTKEQKEDLEEAKELLKEVDKKLTKFDVLYERDEKGKIVKDENGKPKVIQAKDVIFTAEDIMNLGPVERAYMLRRGSAKFYNATHQNKQKIDKLTLEAEDLQHKIDALEEKRSKYVDANGKTKKHHNKQVENYNKQIEKLQEQKKSKDREIDKEKNRHRTERIYSEQ